MRYARIKTVKSKEKYSGKVRGEMEKEEKLPPQENDGEEQSMRDIKPEEASLLKKKLHYYSGEIQRDVGNLVKWLMIAVVVGCVTGAASTLFSFVLKGVTNYRKENGWMFYLLPVMGSLCFCMRSLERKMEVLIRYFLL